MGATPGGAAGLQNKTFPWNKNRSTIQKGVPLKKLKKFIRQKPFSFVIFGMSLLEILIALGLTSGLILLDVKRREKNQISSHRQIAEESIAGLEVSLRSWLRRRNTIEKSFKDTEVVDPVTTISAREGSVAASDNAITKITLDVGSTTGTPVLSQATVNGVTLVGPPLQGSTTGEITSIDPAGLVYIRTMWVENFRPSPDKPETGISDLKVLLWKFSEQTDELDCATLNNCERQVLTIPITTEVTTVPAAGGATATVTVQRGNSEDTGRLNCRDTPMTAIDGPTGPGCRANEVFVLTNNLAPGAAGCNLSGNSDPAKPAKQTTVGCQMGQCCRLVQ